MKKNPFDDALGKQLSFEEVQKMEPAYQGYLDHFQKFRLNGVYTASAGLAMIVGCISAIISQEKTITGVFSLDSAFENSLGIWLQLMGLGFVMLLIGGCIFILGQIKTSRAYRSFDEVMKPLVAAQIAEEQIKKENGHNGS